MRFLREDYLWFTSTYYRAQYPEKLNKCLLNGAYPQHGFTGVPAILIKVNLALPSVMHHDS